MRPPWLWPEPWDTGSAAVVGLCLAGLLLWLGVRLGVIR